MILVFAFVCMVVFLLFTKANRLDTTEIASPNVQKFVETEHGYPQINNCTDQNWVNGILIANQRELILEIGNDNISARAVFQTASGIQVRVLDSIRDPDSKIMRLILDRGIPFEDGFPNKLIPVAEEEVREKSAISEETPN